MTRRIFAAAIVVIIVIGGTLFLGNLDHIWEAIKSFPKDWLLWYVLGALSAMATRQLYRFKLAKRVSKIKHNNPSKSANTHR